MPTNKQRRVAAQRRLQKQLERRAELARRRRRNLLVVVTVVAVVLVAGAVALVAGLGGDDDPGATEAATSSSAAPEATAAPAVTNADGTVSCTYASVPDTTGETNLVDVGTPPDPASTPATGTVPVLMSTSQGDIPLTLDRAKAPCAAASFTYLASQQFFDGTICHREVNAETFGVLQCGDPTGTGSGGPSYTYAEEVTPETTYPRGTIAMANSGVPGSTASQFFLVFTDSQLPPDYTVVGTVDEAGLAVLDTIAAAGNDGSFEPSPGGGAPNVPVTITTMTVVA